MSAVCAPSIRRLLQVVSPGVTAAMLRSYSLDVAAPLLRTQGYVDGRWVSAASVFPVLDPATGQEIARVADCGAAEAKQAVDAAYKAFQSWKRSTAKGIKVDQVHPADRNKLREHQTSPRTQLPLEGHFWFPVQKEKGVN